MSTRTPNLGLIVEDNVTTASRTNLYKLDRLGGLLDLAEDGNTVLSSTADIRLEAEDNIYLGTTPVPADTIYMNATTLDLSGVTAITGLTYLYTNLDFTGSSLTSIEDYSSVISAQTDVALNTNHRGLVNNPHSVTASQTGAYSIAETDAALDLKTDSSLFNAHVIVTTGHGTTSKIVGKDDPLELTNKVINASNNTISNLTNSNVKSNAAIEGTKIYPDFGNQMIITSEGLKIEEGSQEFQFIARTTGSPSSYEMELPETGSGATGRVLGVSSIATTDGDGIPRLRLDWLAVSVDVLPENSVYIGNSSSVKTEVDSSTLGDILGDVSTGLTIKAGAVGDTEVSSLSWSKLDLTVSDIADLTTKSHTSLTDIGSNTHAEIDTHIASTLNPHSVTKDQILSGDLIDNDDISNSADIAWSKLANDDVDYVGFDTGAGEPSTPAEGMVWWNSDDHTLNIQTDVEGTTLQVGQENFLRVRNNTGSTITNGSVVYVSGANSSRALIALAQADADATSDTVIGVATSDIETASFGYVTTFGLVRGLNLSTDCDGVSLSDGDPVYLCATTPGGFVKTRPSAPYHGVRVGIVINAGGGTSGILLAKTEVGDHLDTLHDVKISSVQDNDRLIYNNSAGYWENLPSVTELTKEPTGFEDTSATLTFDSGTRVVTLAHPFNYWYRGKEFNSSTDATWTVPATTGLYFIKFTDNAGTAPVPSTDVWDLEDDVPVAVVYWNNSTSDYVFLEERHGLVLDWRTHQYLHLTRGTQFESGGTASGYVLDSDTLADVQVALEAAYIWDEDLRHTVAAKLEGSNWVKWYRSGASGDWTQGGTEDTIPAYHATNTPKYNEWTGATWQLTDMTNNYYMNIYVLAAGVVGGTDGWYLVPGQAEYSSELAARNEGINSLSLGELPSPETLPFYQITVQYKTAYTGNNARIEIAHVTDLRRTTALGISAGAAGSHGSLSGLGDDDHSQYALLAGRGGASAVTDTEFSYLAGASSNLQTQLDAMEVFKADWVTGDGTSKTVTHSLNSLDVLIELYDKANGATILVDSMVRTDVNTVTLTSTEAPNASGWRVLIKKI